jgi:hypothetical protein
MNVGEAILALWQLISHNGVPPVRGTMEEGPRVVLCGANGLGRTHARSGESQEIPVRSLADFRLAGRGNPGVSQKDRVDKSTQNRTSMRQEQRIADPTF